jgi:hypothetical protein
MVALGSRTMIACSLSGYIAGFPAILQVLTIIRPETLVRLHRAGFRGYWRWKSRPRGGRPQINTELRVLIRRMSVENPLWGAPRIHGELLKLGFEVAQCDPVLNVSSSRANSAARSKSRTKSRYLPPGRPPRGKPQMTDAIAVCARSTPAILKTCLRLKNSPHAVQTWST